MGFRRRRTLSHVRLFWNSLALLMSTNQEIKKDLKDVAYSSRDMSVKAVAELAVSLIENVEVLEEKVEQQEQKTEKLENEVARLRSSDQRS